jgi:Y_Y_Y domain
VTSFAADVSFPSPVFVPITWTATATGGAGPLLYQFWRLRQGVGWTLAQDYSTLNTYSWTPVEADAGTYVLQVWVKSPLSPAAFDSWSGTGSFEITPSGPVQITSLTSSVGLPTTVGTPVTWSATAKGGPPPVQFKFLLREVSGTWSVLRDYSSVSTVTWTPILAGDYVLQVWARSAGSSAAFEDWQWTGVFTINPSSVPVVSWDGVGFPTLATNSLWRSARRPAHWRVFSISS